MVNLKESDKVELKTSLSQLEKSLCLENGNEPPAYELNEIETQVTFKSQIKTISIDINKLNTKFELNERQKKAIEYVIKNSKITNQEYKEINNISSNKTAFRDLNELVSKGVLEPIGEKKGRYYTLKKDIGHDTVNGTVNGTVKHG